MNSALAQMGVDARQTRVRVLHQIKSANKANFNEAIFKAIDRPPDCIAAMPMLQFIQAVVPGVGPVGLMELNEEAAAVGLNAYLPIGAVPTRGRKFFLDWACNHRWNLVGSRQSFKSKPKSKPKGAIMAQVLQELPKRTGVGRTEKYPYDEWLDGKIYQLDAGADFEGKVTAFSTSIRQAAGRRNLKVNLVTLENGVAVQAVPKEESKNGSTPAKEEAEKPKK